jgi:hypothetical protein
MSIADDIDPVECLELAARTISGNVTIAIKNVPEEEDTPEQRAKKLIKYEEAIESILSWAKEGRKARKYAASGLSFVLMTQEKNRQIDQY